MGLNFRNIITAAVFALQLAMLLSLSTGCANIQSPMGGPKDTIPPVLIKATPDENTINFKGNTIKLQFDEYVKLENLNDNLIINPPAERYPIIDGKLRTVSVKIKDTLQPNTTYTFNFGDAVRDVNEANPLKNFSYSFSTGTYIDSMELSGTIIDAETGMPDSTLLILLHSNPDDSAVAKDKPRFVTRANGKGVFHFTHLPAAQFHIFALKDEGVKKYTSNETPFAFSDTPVRTDSASQPIALRAFVGEKPAEKKKAATTGSTKGNKETKEDKKLRYTVSVQGSPQDLLGPLVVTFVKKIDTIYQEKIRLTDTLFAPVAGWKLEKDTTDMSFKITMLWPDNTDFKLILEKGFAKDSLGATTTKNDTVSFKTKAESEYGSIRIKFTGLDLGKHPVLQWVTNDQIVVSAPLTGNEYFVKLFQPSQYKLRVLYDVNQNGIWDTGNYWKKIQPEVVIPVEKAIVIKANWENETEINL